ncbi:L-tryptophan--pyruvate aminotransferase 1-like [Malania oleifera]|uniref:L-tryptophan--pyruvate aminotransferase 1-like n=1 Tax=Malania oleifera TaxID=397392 RepID=UPI0025AEC96A|nr:L-tryptophan--pyruvate aminotransferase 1-like [Malania oleifera]
MCGTEQAAPCTCKCKCSAFVPDNGALKATANNGRLNLSPDSIINLDHGDPKMFESYWEKMGEKCTVVIPGWRSMSYFSDAGNQCWFLEPQLAESIRRLHVVVGNAVAEDRHVVVGNGSSQLFQAALYAVCSPGGPAPVNVVSAVPYYSCYPEVTDFLKSGLYQWGGDAHSYNGKDPYVEVVTSPNNPDGFIRESVVKQDQGGGHDVAGKLIHDLAYYWPHYTPITKPVDHDIMLFTFSKCTGHAGSRIGWALVKDKEVAKKMTKFIELNTIGVSKESQLRAAKIMEVIYQGYQNFGTPAKLENFFEYAQCLMAGRWNKLREVVKNSETFTLPQYPQEYCYFSRQSSQAHPAFAWLKCNKEEIEDCASFLRRHKILTRSGNRFGTDEKYTRISMVDREDVFNLFLKRLSAI